MRPTQHENIQWLYQLLQVPVSLATGLPCEIVHWDNRWINQARLDQATVEAIFQAFWLPPNIHSWPHIYTAEKLPDVVEDLLLRFFKRSFVIGFELPPYLAHFLARHEIGFVDCALSPVRFMDDLLFEVSASGQAADAILSSHKVPDVMIQLQAGVLSSHIAKDNPHPPRPNSLLLIMQTNFDKVVIENGRFVTILDHLDQLLAVAKDYDAVLIKQHPLEQQPDVLRRLTAQLPGSRETNENFYRLAAHPNLKGVAALSSSCVQEAVHFGKKGHYLMPGFQHGTHAVGQAPHNIGDVVITPDFWRAVLDAEGCAVTPQDGVKLPTKPNRFRQQLRSAWGYNQIDTDIPISWAPTA